MIKHIKTITFVVLITVLFACEDRSLFTELSQNRIKVVFKGTFESNNPNDWDLTVNGGSSAVVDDSVDEYDGTSDNDFPSEINIDLAEMKLLSGSSKPKFSNYRQTFSIPLNDTEQFFNGGGIYLKNDDVKPNRLYEQVFLYFRKIILDNAKKYSFGDNGWTFAGYNQTIFREKDYNGFDFNQLLVNTKYDSLKNNSSYINRSFPLKIPISGGFVMGNDEEEVVIEVRIIVKNFIKKYEYSTYDDGNYIIVHFFSVSDWMRNVKKDERAMGGNLLAAARIYRPGKTGTITGTCTAGRHVIAVPYGELLSYYATETHNQRSNIVTECDLPSAPYYPGNDYLDPMIDYFLKIEEYKQGVYEKTSGGCSSFEVYQDEWNAYENIIGNKVMPPLATYADGSSFELLNVAPGSYDVYQANVPPTYGRLYTVSEYTKLNTEPVVVVAGETIDGSR